jgi:hypothetical protein
MYQACCAFSMTPNASASNAFPKSDTVFDRRDDGGGGGLTNNPSDDNHAFLQSPPYDLKSL